MALTRFFFITCLFLFPLLIIASADDYYSSKLNVEKSKLDQVYDVGKSKLDQGYDKDLEKAESEDKSKSKSFDYDINPDVDKSKLDQGYDRDLKKAESEDKSKSKSYGYVEKSKLEQDYDRDLEKAESEDKKSHDYDIKSDVDMKKSDDKPKSENNGYVYKPNAEKSKPKHENDSYGLPFEEKEKSFLIGIQGLILCKAGPKYYPMQGAVARIACLGVDENGYEKKSVFNCRGTTDDKGYFIAKLSPLELTNSLKITECKAFLEKSQSESCKIPTDIKKRISGALLTSYRILNVNDKKTKLYSLKPFFFTSEPESTPSGY